MYFKFFLVLYIYLREVFFMFIYVVFCLLYLMNFEFNFEFILNFFKYVIFV